jgi:hypothetical protein
MHGKRMSRDQHSHCCVIQACLQRHCLATSVVRLGTAHRKHRFPYCCVIAASTDLRGLTALTWRKYATISTTDKTVCIHEIWEKKLGYNETIHQLFIDFTEACDLVRRDVLYSILTEFAITIKLVTLIKICRLFKVDLDFVFLQKECTCQNHQTFAPF